MTTGRDSLAAESAVRARESADRAIECLTGASIEEFGKAGEWLDSARQHLASAQQHLSGATGPDTGLASLLRDVTVRLGMSRKLLHQAAATRFGLAARTFAGGASYTAGGAWEADPGPQAGSVMWVDG